MLALLGAAGPGCGAEDSGDVDQNGKAAGDRTHDGVLNADSDPAAIANMPPGANERPWELITEQGETVLPDIFYADASENEQVMPLTIGGRYGIDRLIYPTLGNPNLFVQGDPKDSLTLVMRLEESLLAHLKPKMSEEVPGSPLTYVDLNQDQQNELAFYLVAQKGRLNKTESSVPLEADARDVFRVKPTFMLANPIADDMPEPFKARRTIRAVFRQSAMKDVPAGLYDLRMEVKKNGDLLQKGGAGLYEYQYNAVRVFDGPPKDDQYTILNVTDTQVSVGSLYDDKTQRQLEQFVEYVNKTDDDAVNRSAFITFNGDLHNGGSPGGLRQRYVATTYQAEAKVNVDLLKRLRFPIFLTVGNHDGYASTGQVPSAVVNFDRITFESLEEVVKGSSPLAWPGMTWDKYDAYRQKSASLPGGFHRDIFTGRYVRRAGATTFEKSYLPLPEQDRNVVLYDGLNQWRRSYGPLYTSWTFGKNQYLSINSFEIRQHRRTGWGMYTVNYGGGVSPVQAEWIGRELDRAEEKQRDVVLLAHHDPRGGHKGQDFGYYFQMVDYHGIGQSAGEYLVGHVALPVACSKIPSWAQSLSLKDDCIHDGLQEWMRSDDEYDCAESERLADGTCNQKLFDPKLPEGQRKAPWFSGYDVIDKMTRHPSVRTLLLGHTHYHSMEVWQSGQEIVPGKQTITSEQAAKLAGLEVQNPVRGFSWISFNGNGEGYDPAALAKAGITTANGNFFLAAGLAAQNFERKLQGAGRELAIMRLTSNADLANQSYQGKPMMGFSTLEVTKKSDKRNYDRAQVNQATYFINTGESHFDRVKSVDLDRNARMTTTDSTNPVYKLFGGTD